MAFRRGDVPVGRWAAEFVLILLSVYLAVFLESASQDRAEAEAARVALAQLLGELREDRDDFVRIIRVQNEQSQGYLDLGRWLAEPRAAPADSVGVAINRIASDNPTLFARRASWNTMISAGQLAALNDPALVLELGQLYETIYARIDYNSALYDGEVTALLQAADVVQWSSLETAPLADDPVRAARLRDGLARLHRTWNLWYRDLLADYLDDVESAVAAVEAHLTERAGASSP